MPIPKKSPTESRNEFIGRCISELVDKDDLSQQQAAAVCYNQLRAINEEKTK
jgi:hypothetical protein